MRFILPIVLLGLFVAPAFADDAFIGCTGDPVTHEVLTVTPIYFSQLIAKTVEHDDHDAGYGFKGNATLYVYNDTNEAWSDFHVSLFSVVAPFGAIFTDASMGGVNPIYQLNGVTQAASWTINNAAVGGPTLDMVFNTFVNPGDTAMFRVYTNNMATKTRFGVAYYPTTDYVPEPSSMLAMSSALLGLAGYVIKRKR